MDTPVSTAGLRPMRLHSDQAGATNVHPYERVASNALGVLLVAGGIRRGSIGGLLTAIVGGGLLYRGVTGQCPVYRAMGVTTVKRESSDQSKSTPKTREIRRTVTIDKPALELHQLWLSAETLRQVMAPIAVVDSDANGKSHWAIRTPLGRVFEWDSEIVEDYPGELVRWRSTAGSRLTSEGVVRFTSSTTNRGTQVTLALQLQPPGGAIGMLVLRALRVVPNTFAFRALQRFKSLAETGEIATTEGSPSARESDPALHNRMQQTRIATGLGWFSVGLGLMELAAPHRVARIVGMADRPLLMRMFGLRELASGIGILSSREQRTPWMWSRVAGDAMDLALLGTALRSPDSNRLRVAATTLAVAGVTAADTISSVQHTVAARRAATGSAPSATPQ